jgi:DNA-binding CsgD family transcriptional regulator
LCERAENPNFVRCHSSKRWAKHVAMAKIARRRAMGVSQQFGGQLGPASLDINEVLRRALGTPLGGAATRSFEWTADGEAPRHLQIRAVSLGPSDTVILVHDAGQACPAAVEDLRDHGSSTDEPRYSLTSRQLAVLRLIALGATDKEVAVKLGISTFTASKHVANILSKMQASCRTEASVLALQSGLLQPA